MAVTKPELKSTPLQTASKLIAKIRKLNAKVEQLRTEQAHVQWEIREASFEWVTIMVTVKKFKSDAEAILALAGTVNRTEGTVTGWYYDVKFARTHNIETPTSPNSVAVVRKAQHTVSKAVLLKAINAIKQHEPVRKVYRIIRTAEDKAGVSSKRRVDSIIRSKRATRQMLRMELVAMQTLADKVFKKTGCNIVILDPSSGDVLEQIGGEEN